MNINWHWITAFNGLVYIAAAIRLSFDHFHNFMLKSISLSMACAKYAHLVFECTRPKTVVFSWDIAFLIVCIWPHLRASVCLINSEAFALHLVVLNCSNKTASVKTISDFNFNVYIYCLVEEFTCLNFCVNIHCQF